MKDMKDLYLDHEKTAAFTRPTAESIKATSNTKPVIVVSYNPQSHTSQQMLKRLDKVLTEAQGLKRVKIVALNEMVDKNIMGKLEIPMMGVSVFSRGEKAAVLEGLKPEMEITKFIQENRQVLT